MDNDIIHLKNKKNVKVGILTFHRACNMGAVLQAYSFFKALSSFEVEVEIIDYTPECFRYLYYDEPSEKYGNTNLTSKMKHLLMAGRLKKKNKGFIRFIEKNTKVSKPYSRDDLDGITSDDYDILFTGSDQVWNNLCAEFDPVFFLYFKKKTNFVKASYAASFGFKSIPDILRTEYKQRLSEIQYFSVREETGKNIIEDLLGAEASVCCDPTLLTTRSEWESVVIEEKEIFPEDYIFVYFVNRSDELLEYAKRLGKKTGYPIICVSGEMNFSTIMGIKDKKYHFYQDITCSPEKFLLYIRNCSYLITSSFHGTVFGIIFHRQFQTFLRTTKGNDARIGSLLNRLDLQSRCIDNGMEHINDIILWENVDEKINKFRDESFEYITNIVNKAKVLKNEQEKRFG